MKIRDIKGCPKCSYKFDWEKWDRGYVYTRVEWLPQEKMIVTCPVCRFPQEADPDDKLPKLSPYLGDAYGRPYWEGE